MYQPIKFGIVENKKSVRFHAFYLQHFAINCNQTYIFDEDEKYVIVLEPYRKCFEYYLLSAYYLDEEYGIENIKKKYQKKLDEVY